jgi:hypothetical protein
MAYLWRCEMQERIVVRQNGIGLLSCCRSEAQLGHLAPGLVDTTLNDSLRSQSSWCLLVMVHALGTTLFLLHSLVPSSQRLYFRH